MYSYLIPNWFFGFDIAMELLFALVTLAIAVVSAKMYWVSRDRKIGLFGVAFACIGVSYLIWAFANLWFVGAVNDGFKSVSLESFIFFDAIAAYAFMFLFTLGLVCIVYISCDLREVKSFSLILGLALMVVAASEHKLVTFRLLSVFLLLFIVMRYINEYLEKRSTQSMYVLIGFTMLLLGSADFILSGAYYQTYIIGHFLELSAYLTLLVVLVKSIQPKK
jgi:hypothetical protein